MDTIHEHFDDSHIHTTPDGRHFRHGDGAEVDGDGNPIEETRGMNLSEQLYHALLHALADLPPDRAETRARILAALEAYEESLPVPAPT